MELNGLANIHMMLQTAKMDNTKIDPILADKITEQLHLLERYILAYTMAMEVQVETAERGEPVVDSVPFWHEVRQNPELYPSLKDRVDILKRAEEID